MTDGGPPASVEEAARRRSAARLARDWATADHLRDEIEAAGWRVIDSGSTFRLERAVGTDVEVGGEIRYGSSAGVPSRLGDPDVGLATVVVVASPDPAEARRCLDGLLDHAPAGVDIVLVADGLPDRALDGLRPRAEAGRPGELPVELVRTSVELGRAGAINVGMRRARAGVLVVLDPWIVPTGDLVSPLVEALADPTVAVVGWIGLVSDDLLQFREADAAGTGTQDVAAIDGSLMAFRRADAGQRGPLDERFRSASHLGAWWSLVLRDAGDGGAHRRAVSVPGLPVERHARAAGAGSPEAERLARRNRYRVLDRFRHRPDLVVPNPSERA